MVEAVLVLVIAGLLGFIGWYVYSTKQDADKSLSTAAATTKPSTAKTAQNKPSLLNDASVFTAYDKSFSVIYPKDYPTESCNFNGQYFGLAIKQDSLGACVAGQPRSQTYGSRINFQSYPKPPNFDITENPNNYDRQAEAFEASYKHTYVELNGKKVDKTVSVSGQSDVVSGQVTTTYRYFDGSNLWYAVYTEEPNSKELSKYFDAMIQTWKF